MKSDIVSFSRITLWRKSELGVLFAAVNRVPSISRIVSRIPKCGWVILKQQIWPYFPFSINHFLGLTEYLVGRVVHLELRTTPS